MLSWEYPPNLVGGLARHVQGLAQGLTALGVDVTVLTGGGEHNGCISTDGEVRVVWSVMPNLWSRTFVEGVHHLDYALVRDAISLHSQEPFDLIHAHDWSVAFAAGTLKHGFRLPLVATIHATERGRNLGIGTDEQKYISQGDWFLTYEAWQVICCSLAMRDEVTRYLSVPEDKVRVIPNATNPENFVGRFNRKLFRSRFVREEEKLILFVGRLVYEKGAHILLKAAGCLNKSLSRSRLVLVGQGDLAWHRRIALETGIAERVAFVERIPDKSLWNLYRVADVAVFPSLYEPFGIVAIESMAAGGLTLVSDVGGLSEIVEDGVDGVKFAPGNVLSLTHALERALADTLDSSRIRRRAQAKVRCLYTWPRVARDTLQVYQTVLEERRRAVWHDHLALPAVRTPLTAVNHDIETKREEKQ